MSAPDPTPENGYLILPQTLLDPETLNLIFGSLHQRLTAREATDLEEQETLDQIVAGALTYIANTIAPRIGEVQELIDGLEQNVSAAEDRIAEIGQGGGVSADLVAETTARVFLTPAQRMMIAATAQALTELGQYIDAAIVGVGDDLAELDQEVEQSLALKLDAGNKASAADWRAGTDDAKFVTVKSAYEAAALVAVAGAGAIDLDFATGINFEITITVNSTLNVPVNMKNGQSGVIYFIVGVASRTISLAAGIRKVGTYTLPTAVNSITRCAYLVRGGVLELSGLEVVA